MADYVFIESRDPFESRDTPFVTQTAASLRQSGKEVVVFLVQNGVLGARKDARISEIPQLAEAGVTLLADQFSLDERGIGQQELSQAIRRSSIEELVDLLLKEKTKAIWH
jgi:sulfur transfer complex TusBCD TusB component (DsrH family)